MRDRARENAHRLAGAIERHAAEAGDVERLAAVLNYQREQLQEDAQSLLQYIERLEAAANADHSDGDY